MLSASLNKTLPSFLSGYINTFVKVRVGAVVEEKGDECGVGVGGCIHEGRPVTLEQLVHGNTYTGNNTLKQSWLVLAFQ